MEKVKNIVLITDCTDIAVEQIKARFTKMLKENKLDCRFFNAFTSPFQINNGLFLGGLLSEEISHGNDTIFLGIVNPLKKKPMRIFGKLKNGSWFLGTNTGMFSLLFEKYGVEEVWETNNPGHYPFGGLHVHTTAAANLLSGEDKEKIGKKKSLSDLKIEFPKKGEVVHIDNFGLIKIWMRREDIPFSEDSKIMIKIFDNKGNIKGEEEAIYSHRMMNYEDDALIIYPGSSLLNKNLINDNENFKKSGLLELGLVRNPNSAKNLNIKMGDILIIEDAKQN